jgi:hypothetical protein
VKKILFMMLIAMPGLSIQSNAQGNLLIAPMRVVFEGNKQKAGLNLVNIGTDTATFSISFKQYNMTEDGMLKLIEKPETTQMFAEPYLRIFPRRVTLAPGEAQVIMLQCRRKPTMLAGEYRSHIWFRSEKNYNLLGEREPLLDSNQLSISIIPIFGITIPVIIRSGEVSVSATLSNLKLDIQQDNIQNLTLTINRTGNISIYGDIIIEYTPVRGKSYEIGKVKGVGVYTNIIKRNITVKLDNTSGEPLTNGELKVRYVSNGETKQVVYAEAKMEVK